METTTLIEPGAKDDSFAIPPELLENLKPNASLIITEARAAGTISTRSLAAMMKPDAVSSRDRLQSTVSLLDAFLLTIGVGLARGNTDLQLRALPLPRLHAATLSINFRSASSEDLKILADLEKHDEFDNSDLALYKEVVRRCPILPNDQLVELFKKREQGDIEAQHLLVLHNLRLVFSIAKRYQGRGLDLPDLVQEGVIGLLTAISKFKWQLGYHLTTYATWWIRQGISRSIADRARAIRLPVHLGEKYYKIMKVQKALIFKLGREPTNEEIGKEIGLPERFVTALRRSVSNTESDSLECPNGPEEDSRSYGETLADTQTLSPVSVLEAKETLQDVVGEIRALMIKLGAIPKFDGRWRQIFKMRYGLDGTFFARPTLEEVGQKFGVTRERIRQIVEICWERLLETGATEDEDWLLTRLGQVEELESITGILTQI